jgi:hypothetical protein
MSKLLKLMPSNGKPLTLFTPDGVHSLTIPAEGCEVPERFRRAALAEGCNLVNDDGSVTIIDDVGDNTTGGESTDTLIRQAIEKLLDGDDEANFTADGRPTVDAVSATCGFKVSKDDVARVWALVKEDLV